MEPILLTVADSVLTRAEAKLHLRVDGDDEDSLIDSLIQVAVLDATNRTERSIGLMVWELRLDKWPEEIKLPKGPVNKVSSIKYLDSESEEATLASNQYTIENTTYHSIIKPVDEWPIASGGIKIRYEAGYPEGVQAPVKQWLLLCIGHLYRNRELAIDKALSAVPFADSLLHPYMEVGV